MKPTQLNVKNFVNEIRSTKSNVKLKMTTMSPEEEDAWCRNNSGDQIQNENLLSVANMLQVFCPHWRKSKRVLAPGQLSFIQLHQLPLLYFFCNLPYLSGRFNILRIMTTTVCVIKAPIPRQFIMCVEAARLKILSCYFENFTNMIN